MIWIHKWYMQQGCKYSIHQIHKSNMPSRPIYSQESDIAINFKHLWISFKIRVKRSKSWFWSLSFKSMSWNVEKEFAHPNLIDSYCWWLKSCTSWYGKYYPIIYRVWYIPGGAGFLPSTVSIHFHLAPRYPDMVKYQRITGAWGQTTILYTPLQRAIWLWSHLIQCCCRCYIEGLGIGGSLDRCKKNNKAVSMAQCPYNAHTMPIVSIQFTSTYQEITHLWRSFHWNTESPLQGNLWSVKTSSKTFLTWKVNPSSSFPSSDFSRHNESFVDWGNVMQRL